LVLRCKKYPKKGSNEWIISGDSVESRVIEKEKKNNSFLVSDITEVRLNTSVLSLAFTLEIDGRYAGRPLIFYREEDAGIAQKVHDFVIRMLAEKEQRELEDALHLINTDDRFLADRESIRRNDERIKHNDEMIKQGEEQTKRNNELNKVLDELEIQINRNVFTEPEMQEIAKLKQQGIDNASQLADLIESSTKLTVQGRKLIEKRTKILERRGREDQIHELDEQIHALDDQIYALDDEQVNVFYAATIAQLESLKNWLTLGQQRPTDFGLPK
jgi:hypothetical protein